MLTSRFLKELYCLTHRKNSSVTWAHHLCSVYCNSNSNDLFHSISCLKQMFIFGSCHSCTTYFFFLDFSFDFLVIE